jgi:hypothetical protein
VRNGQHGARGMRKAIATHPAVPDPGQGSTLSRTDHDEVAAGVRQLDQRRPRLAADNNPPEIQVSRYAAACCCECLCEPLAGRVRPDPAEFRIGESALCEIAARRNPGECGHDWNIGAAG